jgi:hypothetical protein
MPGGQGVIPIASSTLRPSARSPLTLGRWLPRTEVTIRSVSLVAQAQVGRSRQWRPVAEVPFSSG